MQLYHLYNVTVIVIKCHHQQVLMFPVLFFQGIEQTLMVVHGAYISGIDTIITSYMLFSENEAWNGGGGICIDPSDAEYYHTNYSYLIQDSVFYRNMASLGAALYFADTRVTVTYNIEIFMVHCNILENFAVNGAALYIESPYYPVTVFLSKTNIVGNRADNMASAIGMTHTKHIHTVVHLQHDSAVIKLENAVKCQIYETKFFDNTGSSIVASQSNVSLQGHVEFSGNTAYAGAALLLDCPDYYDATPSILTLLPNTTVTITNNTALYYGGGIAVNPICDYGDYCVFQVPYYYGSNTMAYFENNKAHMAGNSIYGPSVSQCKMMDGVLGEQVLLTLFSIEGGFSSDQVVLAQIYSVCFCEVNLTELACSTIMDKSVFPGEEFSVTALFIEQLKYLSQGLVRAHLTTPGDSGGQLGTSKLQDIQELKRSCGNQLTYSVMTTAKTALIKLQVEDIPDAPSSYINITILQCPLGFKFNNSQRKCDCNKYLRSKLSQITCDITREAFNVSGNVWIGNLSNNRLGCPPTLST